MEVPDRLRHQLRVRLVHEVAARHLDHGDVRRQVGEVAAQPLAVGVLQPRHLASQQAGRRADRVEGQRAAGRVPVPGDDVRLVQQTQRLPGGALPALPGAGADEPREPGERGAVDVLYGPADGVSGPTGVAIDATDRVFTIGLLSGQSVLARWFDPEGRTVRWLAEHGWLGKYPPGRIYWTNNDDNTVRGASLDGVGPVDTLYGGPDRGVYWPNFLALLRAPLGTGAPTISGGPLRQPLRCSHGAWAADVAGAFLYRTPQGFRYQWSLDGGDIDGATLSAYTPTAAGSYACRVTATNQAGSATQTSAAVALS